MEMNLRALGADGGGWTLPVGPEFKMEIPEGRPA